MQQQEKFNAWKAALLRTPIDRGGHQRLVEGRAQQVLPVALSRRDAARMAVHAELLLDPRFSHSSAQLRYLIITGMTGHLMAGNRDKAAAIWKRFPKIADKEKDFTLRLLYGHAFAATAP